MTAIDNSHLMKEPECMCCPMMDVCNPGPGTCITITRDIIRRSNCNGGFIDALEIS
jgi:hypothetical protein